jgi:VWFA-related protein
MRVVSILALFLCMTAFSARAQQGETAQSTLTVRSTLVEVPVLVKTKAGQIVFELAADDFLLTDNGVPQHLTLDEDTDSQPLALAVVVETGGAGAGHLADYRHFDPILDALIGNVEHRVAVIGFDSAPHLVLPFTPDTSEAARQLANLRAGDNGSAILDGVAFAVAQLRVQPPRYRRAILLLSETLDRGSKTSLDEALRLISDTNTSIYSFGFSSTRSAVSHEASKFNRPDEPGPAHGCFSRKGADAEYKGHYSSQVLDCISDLAPPVRLATMAFLAARDSLRKNTTESIAKLTGGEFIHFHNSKDLDRGLIAVSNDVHNYYVLSFHPETPTPGMHALKVGLREYPQLRLEARSEYWMDKDAGECAGSIHCNGR